MFLVWLLTVMLMMKSDAAFTKVVNAQSGEAVLLTPDWQGLENKQDVRWTHTHLVMSLKKNMSLCHHGRCKLLKNGSLTFSRVQAEDSGNYSMQVFAENGHLLNKSYFFLNVQESSSSPGSTVVVVVSILLCCFILVIIFIFIFIKRRRSQNTSATTGPLQENIYVVMHGDHANKKKGEAEEVEKKQEEEKQEEEEESHYVPCNAVVSLETPITLSVDAEDIYV